MVRIHNVPPNPSFPHAFSGNPGGVRMDPRLKHLGVTGFWESHLFTSSYFRRRSARRPRRDCIFLVSVSFVSFVTLVVQCLLLVRPRLCIARLVAVKSI